MALLRRSRRPRTLPARQTARAGADQMASSRAPKFEGPLHVTEWLPNLFDTSHRESPPGSRPLSVRASSARLHPGAPGGRWHFQIRHVDRPQLHQLPAARSERAQSAHEHGRWPDAPRLVLRREPYLATASTEMMSSPSEWSMRAAHSRTRFLLGGPQDPRGRGGLKPTGGVRVGAPP